MSRLCTSVVFVLLVVAAASLAIPLLALSDPLPPTRLPLYVDGEVIIKFRQSAGPAQVSTVAGDLQATVSRRLKFVGAELWTLNGLSVEDAVSRYRNDPRIEYIEPNYYRYADGIPNDPEFGLLWGMNNTGQSGGVPDVDIDAPEAWDLLTGDFRIVVGVVDTGIDYNHEDLADNIWTNPGEIPGNGVDDDGNGYVDDIHGWDFANDDSDPMDDHGHGTHVAGTIGATGNNGKGVAGVCWDVQLVAIKFLARDGKGDNASAIESIDYATRIGCRLTNNSWGGGPYSAALEDAIARADGAGILFVASAGNDGLDNDVFPHYPSSYDLKNILSVANIQHDDQLYQSSNYGVASVDLGAPGTNIRSCLPGNLYSGKTGTSMAGPHVAGAAALLWSRAPLLTHDEIRDRIFASVVSTPVLGATTATGGRLNVFNALVGLDSIAPAMITDLAVTTLGSNTVTLSWTASGNDGNSGTARVYDIRFSTGFIDESNFEAATPFADVPAPAPQGSAEVTKLSGLAINTLYFFALKVIDEAGNASPVSNIGSGTTPGAPRVSYSPPALADSLVTGGESIVPLTIRNNATGTLDFEFLNLDGPASPDIPWLHAVPGGGTVSAGDSAVVALVFNATGLPGGLFTADAQLGTNDPAAPITHIPAELRVFGATDIAVSPDVLDFGEQYRDYSVTDTVLISNIGVDELFVYSATVDHDWFSVSPGGFSLPPGGSLPVSVTFLPDATGPVATALVFASNDPDSPELAVALSGESVVPPDIALAPGLLVEALRTGERAEHTVTISNNGAADLDWHVSFRDSVFSDSQRIVLTPPPSDVSPPPGEPERIGPGRLSVPRSPLHHEVLNMGGMKILWDRSHGQVPSSHWSTLISDLMARGATLTENDSTITSGLLIGVDFLWLVDSPDMWSPAEQATVRNWVSSGGALLIEADQSTQVYNGLLEGSGIRFDDEDALPGFTAFIYEHPVTSGVTSVFLGGPLSRLKEITAPAAPLLDDTAHRPVGAAAVFGGGRIVAFSDEIFVNADIGAADNQLLGNRVFDWLRGGAAWLNASLYSGSVPGYSSEQVTIVFNATGLGGGEFEADLFINSNDPVKPRLSIPTLLVVSSAPDINVSQTTMDFGGLFVGEVSPKVLFVMNDGVENLVVTHVLFDNESFTSNVSAYTMPPGGIFPLELTFRPVDAGEIEATLSIVSNDPDESVKKIALIARALFPPIARVSPNALATGLITGASDIQTLEISNDGANNLDWQIDIPQPASWLRTTSSAGSTPPGTTQHVELIFDASGLPNGLYQEVITVLTNDPIRARITVQVILGVTGVADIDVSPDSLFFGDIYTSVTALDTIRVTNAGATPLVVNSISVVSGSGFGVPPTPFVLRSSQSRDIAVSFAPARKGPFKGLLSIRTNDPDEPESYVRLFGDGVYPPALSVSGATTDSLNTGEQSARPVVIANTGLSPLVWNVEIAATEESEQLNETTSASWIGLDPTAGVTDPGEADTVLVLFDASGLDTERYQENVVVRSNDPAGPELILPAVLFVTGAPDVTLLQVSPDFGDVFIDQSGFQRFPVRNDGFEALTVFGWVSGDPDYSVLSDTLVIPPGSIDSVQVVFSPTHRGVIGATLELITNDPDETFLEIVLTGNGVPPPVLAVTPVALADSLEWGSSTTHHLYVGNKGESDLKWSLESSERAEEVFTLTEPDPAAVAVEERGSAALPVHLPESRNPGGEYTLADLSGVKILWDRSHGQADYYAWSTLVSDLEARGAVVSTNIAPVTPSVLDGVDILWLTETPFPWTTTELTAIENWLWSGGGILLEGDNTVSVSNFNMLLFTVGAGILYSDENGTDGLTTDIHRHTTTERIGALYLNNNIARLFNVAGNARVVVDDAAGVPNTAAAQIGSGRIVAAADELFENFRAGVADNQLFGNQVIDWLAGAIDWLALDPQTGSTGAGQTDTVNVYFVTTGTVPGPHDAIVLLTSNDPRKPLLEIPVSLEVTGDPPWVATREIPLQAGFNLRSWNVNTETDSTVSVLAPVLPGLRVAGGYNGNSLRYDPSGSPAANTLLTMDHLHGYWFDMTDERILSIRGETVDPTWPVPLSAGYNLVGYLPQFADSICHALESVMDNVESVTGYDNGGLIYAPWLHPDYNTLAIMRPTYGYWIVLSAPDTLVYPGGSVVPPGTAVAGPPPAGYETGDNNPDRVRPSREWIGVWGEDVRVNGEPVAVGTIVSAVDGHGVKCGETTVERAGRFGLMAVYRDDPATEIDEGAEPGEEVILVFSAADDTGGPATAETGVRWTALGGVVRFEGFVSTTETSRDRVPSETALYQNYPNPFNPETAIRYDLRQPEHVKITIFNTRGQHVRTLVDGQQGAGRYTVRWSGLNQNGHTVASGIYFFRLEAGPVTQTRKMILLK